MVMWRSVRTEEVSTGQKVHAQPKQMFGKTLPRCVLRRNYAVYNSNDLEHNIWKPLFDALSDYRIGPVLCSLLEDEIATGVGLTSHFALGVVLHATALDGS